MAQPVDGHRLWCGGLNSCRQQWQHHLVQDDNGVVEGNIGGGMCEREAKGATKKLLDPSLELTYNLLVVLQHSGLVSQGSSNSPKAGIHDGCHGAEAGGNGRDSLRDGDEVRVLDPLLLDSGQHSGLELPEVR